MARGQEETSTSGRPGGRLRATPSASSIISSLTMEELMAYCEVPGNIDLQLMERTDESTLGGEHNDVFFTQEHLAAGLHFPVPALVKQFLHFTRAPPALIHLQHHSHFDRVLRVEPPISTRPLIGRAMYTLFFESRAGRPDVYVSSESPTSGC